MYSDLFCRIYDEFGWNYYPEAFAGQLLEWIRQKQLCVRSCLDLGCGTGILCGILSQHGIASRGSDLSEGMIRIAKEHYPEVPFDTGDMTVPCPEYIREGYDLVTCTGDAVNHLSGPAQIRKVFENVYRYLNSGGYFVFDLLHPGEISDGEPIPYDYSENVKAFFRMSTDESGGVTLQVKVYEDGEFRLEETICENIYAPEMICGMLEETGFTQIRCAHHLLEEGGNDVTTWYVVCRKSLK